MDQLEIARRIDAILTKAGLDRERGSVHQAKEMLVELVTRLEDEHAKETARLRAEVRAALSQGSLF